MNNKDRNFNLNAQCIECEKEFDIQINSKDYQDWRQGKKIQEAMPYLSPSQRELLISGTCGECFIKMFNSF